MIALLTSCCHFKIAEFSFAVYDISMKLTDTSPSTEALLARLLNHPLPAIELKLERVQRLLERLGDPHLSLPPAVHVAGTNGKGSLIAYLRAMLEAGGYRCHVYTSPHLVRFHERIVVGGEEISDSQLQDVLTRVAEISGDCPVTFFESTTAAAFLAFAETPADIVLLETGMGGRLDATNLIPRPALTVITPVSMDHTEFLGDTLAKIAYEKAGIMKMGVHCVLGPQEEEALAVLEKRAAEVSAPLLVHGRDFHREGKAYFSPSLSLKEFAPSLPGEFQYDNAATAIACAEILSERFPMSPGHLLQGIAGARWPARLQRLEGGALNALLGEGRALWLDGGHNPAAGEAIARWLKERGGQRIHLVLGMLADKDARGYLAPMAAYLASVTAVPIPDELKSADTGTLAGIAASLGIAAETASSLEEALRRLSARADRCDTLIGGSLYLAGAVLAKSCHDSEGTML